MSNESRPEKIFRAVYSFQQHEGDPHFITTILAADEADFTRNRMHNGHNIHIWSDVNPYAILEHRFQEQFAVNVLVGLVNNYLIGPYILPHRLTGRDY
ncbi:hypothetical protein BDFB_007394 [Asbolus verrucosus]|uniref:Uncharacterized protein n=1 Tax=Asbolus verrucosus TaxID=1661398 RepID=A0A482VPJ8_ASBVE|nr:hypothetical protein BDFB_007394 [Asbolus verrucosus]